ncbi:MAG: 30S ribosomal protein S3 [Deltaproteobacteria bacterium RIFOXYA12_FULL_61_11]|nr:MAG: 30S ribosomal protein S3 [Deltaproteobacteria bacterium RIFOXYA12_FULL_61_11]
MGQKVHPTGFRLGIIRTWDSKWFAEKDYRTLLHEDLMLRRYFKAQLGHAGIAKVDIERPALKHLKINLHTSKPGLIIGKRGAEIEVLKDKIQRKLNREVFINIREIRKPEIDSQLVAENIASQLSRRVSFRRVMKKAVSMAMKMGAEGIKINCAGRLGGAEMSRRENYKEGKIPLHTLRADIDYALAEAKTTYGVIGVKVWIYKGEVLPPQKNRTA